MGLDLLKGPEHRLLQGGVVHPAAQVVRQTAEVRLHFPVPHFQQGFQHLTPDHRLLVGLQLPEIRPQGAEDRVLPQDRGAEAVDGADGSPIHQGELPPEPETARIPVQSLGQSVLDAAAELRCRRPGIGNEQEPIQIQIVPEDAVQQPLHQHPGLAGTGSRRNEQGGVPVFHRRPLGGGEGKISHSPPPPFPAPARIRLPSGF